MRSDFNKICRLCLKLNVQLSYIFSKQSPLFTNFCKVVSKVTATPIFEGDSLPSQICSDCMNTVFEVLKFRKVCKNSFLFLQNFILKNEENVCIVDHIARTNIEQQQLNKEVQNGDNEEQMDTATSEVVVNDTDVGNNSSEIIQDEELDVKIDVCSIDSNEPIKICDDTYRILLDRYANELKEESSLHEEESNILEEENEEVDIKINVCNLEPNVLVSISEDAFQILENTSRRLQGELNREEILVGDCNLFIKDEVNELEYTESNNTEESVSQNKETINTEASIYTQKEPLTYFDIKSCSPKKTTKISKNCKSVKGSETKNISTHINNVIARLLDNASKKLNVSKRKNANQNKKVSDKRKPLLSSPVDSHNKSKDTKKSNSCLVNIKKKVTDKDTGYKRKKLSTSKINKSASSAGKKLRERRSRYSAPPRYIIVQESRFG